MKGKNWTKPQRFIIAISGILIAISGYLTFTQGTLFGLAAPTISILSIFSPIYLLLSYLHFSVVIKKCLYKIVFKRRI